MSKDKSRPVVRIVLSGRQQDKLLSGALSQVLGIRESYVQDHIIYMNEATFGKFLLESNLTAQQVKAEVLERSKLPVITHYRPHGLSYIKDNGAEPTVTASVNQAGEEQGLHTEAAAQEESSLASMPEPVRAALSNMIGSDKLEELLKSGNLQVIEVGSMSDLDAALNVMGQRAEELTEASRFAIKLAFDTFYVNNVGSEEEVVDAWQHLSENGGMVCSHISLRPQFRDTPVFEVWERANDLLKRLMA